MTVVAARTVSSGSTRRLVSPAGVPSVYRVEGPARFLGRGEYRRARAGGWLTKNQDGTGSDVLTERQAMRFAASRTQRLGAGSRRFFYPDNWFPKPAGMGPLFVGLIERNEWEREQWSYLVAETPANLAGLALVAAALAEQGADALSYRVDLHGVERKVLEDRAARMAPGGGCGSRYMAATQFIAEPVDWSSLAASIRAGEEPLYKGRGLTLGTDLPPETASGA
jgi:hypothetical protein